MHSAIIFGCVKDCGTYIDGVFNNIQKLSTVFDIQKIVVSYDHSQDNTLELLKEKQDNYPVEILINDNELVKDLSGNLVRVINISNARNKYMDYLSQLNQKPDYFIVMDMDDVCSSNMNVDNIKYVMEKTNSWDGITFDNKRYYDFWALSLRPFTFSCFLSTNPVNTIKKMHDILVQERKKHVDFIPCSSAFNGFGIYKTSKYGHSRYFPWHRNDLHFLQDLISCKDHYHVTYFKPNEFAIDCEHRAFHISAYNNNKAKLVISKKQLFDDYHGEHVKWLYDN